MPRHLLVPVAFAVAFAVGDLSAQTTPLTAVTPPAAKLDPRLISPYHRVFSLIKVENGEEQDVGTLEDQVVIRDDNGTPAIIRVQNVDGPTGVMSDSAIADATNLLPRRHSSEAEHRTIQLQFAPNHVTGTIWESGDPPIPIDQQIGEGVFDSNMLDVLIAALPLAPGYSGRLTVYLYEAGGATPVDVAVTGSENVGGVDTWITDVTLGRRTAKYYIGKSDHRVQQILSSPGPGIEIRLVPKKATAP